MTEDSRSYIIDKTDLKALGNASPDINKYELLDKLKQQGPAAPINDWADYWYYIVGVNVIPADTKNKVTNIKWAEWQNKPIPKELHCQWKKTNAYAKGLALLPGKVWRGTNVDKFLVFVDLDNQKAIDEICNVMMVKDLSGLYERIIVEQHKDNLSKAHIYFYSVDAFSRKGTDATKFKDKIDSNEIPAIEVKGLGEHGLAYCSPSPHKNGARYEIIGTFEPHTCGKAVENLLFAVYKKYGFDDAAANIQNGKVPIETLFKKDFVVYEGHNRHEALMRIMESLIQKNRRILELDQIKKLSYEWNKKQCKPPLDDKEFEKQWGCAVQFINKNSKDSDPNNTNTQRVSSSGAERTSLVELAAEEIMSSHDFLTFEESKDILYYRNGVYVPGGETIIEKQSEEMLKYALKNKDIEEIKGHIRRQTYRSRKEIDSDINIINLRNGLYDINKNELRPHSPSYYSINQKPIVYDPKAKPKMFGNFLSQVLYQTEIRTAIEVMAYTFYRDCPFEHFFKLFGYGANGKSVFTGLLTKLHGERNVSNVSLTSLIDNRFAAADLEFKDVNIDAELSAAVIKDTSLLKKLTGGRKQPIRIEQKYKQAYDTYLYAKLFFNANTITETTDQTAAYYRRQIIISFPNTFEGKKDDPQLLDKLTSEEEMSGIFNVLMHFLRMLLKNNGIYLHEKTIDARTAKHERAVNPVKAFVVEAIAYDSTESDYVIKADLYSAFRKYCKKYSLAPKSEVALGKDLKKLGWMDSRESKGETRRTCWIGRKLKSEFVCADEQQQVTLWTN